MQIPLVMTIIGPDRTGLVEAVARAVATHGGNWLESRMCRLGGEFAGILRIEVPAEKKTQLLEALQKISGLTVTIHTGETKISPANTRQTEMEIIGQDRPGIVHEISTALARAGVNVEEFSSEVVSGAMSGETLFKASARLQLPNNCNLAVLKQEVEKIAADLLVDVSFGD
ncbi:MAG TPA: ACT domain-containing protein [Candidatus Acidoferrales bacterium]|jgi:glycine cleavage system regulatory protein|nr:ACT domain-containing protein [Candidatus Acidoferrales bacterium]